MSGKAIRETLGFVAVVAGLVVVGLEVRQNTTAVESATAQGLSQQLSDINVALLTDDRVPGLLFRIRNGELPADFSGEENQRVRLFYITHIRIFHSAWQQVGLGVLDEQVYDQLPAGIWTYAYIKAAWPSLRYNFDPSFADFL